MQHTRTPRLVNSLQYTLVAAPDSTDPVSVSCAPTTTKRAPYFSFEIFPLGVACSSVFTIRSCRSGNYGVMIIKLFLFSATQICLL